LDEIKTYSGSQQPSYMHSAYGQWLPSQQEVASGWLSGSLINVLIRLNDPKKGYWEAGWNRQSFLPEQWPSREKESTEQVARESLILSELETLKAFKFPQSIVVAKAGSSKLSFGSSEIPGSRP
jgi:hypothetical protein